MVFFLFLNTPYSLLFYYEKLPIQNAMCFAFLLQNDNKKENMLVIWQFGFW